MKRYLSAALLLASFSTLTLVGCSEESKVVEEKKVSTPDGTEKQKVEVTTEKTGDMKDGGAPKPADAPH